MTTLIKTKEQDDRAATALMQQEAREELLLKEGGEQAQLTAKDLKQGLSGDLKQRMEEEKTVHIVFKYGERPDVTFTGFWNGQLVRNAQNALSRSYRQRRHKNMRAHANEPNPLGAEKENGDGR